MVLLAQAQNRGPNPSFWCFLSLSLGVLSSLCPAPSLRFVFPSSKENWEKAVPHRREHLYKNIFGL